MTPPSRPLRLLLGIGLVLAGLLTGILLMLVMEDSPGADTAVRVVKQVERPARPATQRPLQADSGRPDDVPPPSTLNRVFRDVAQDVTDAVVSIRVDPEEAISREGGSDGRFSPPSRPQNLGSGVLISPEGYLVTNRHVVEGAETVQVTLADKRQYEGRVVGKDASTDLAVVKIDDPADFPVLPLGASDQVKVGDWVVAVGNPFRLTSTVTAGIVSALDRQLNIIEDQFSVESFIQTDAAINPGNSGGALVNLQGELVGINTAIASGTGAYEGYGFAIPSALVERVVTDLITYGEVRRGYLGVQIAEVDAQVAERMGLDDIRGVYVDGVRSGGAAARAGVQGEDVIVAVQGQPVDSPGELQSVVALQRPGDTVSVRLWRNGGERTVNVQLMGEDTPAYQNWLSDLQSQSPSGLLPESRRPNDDAEALLDVEAWGIGLRPVRAREESRFGVEEGAYVAYVEQGSRAADGGLPRGVVVTALDETPVETPGEVQTVVREKGDEPVLVRVRRPDGTTAFYEIE